MGSVSTIATRTGKAARDDDNGIRTGLVRASHRLLRRGGVASLTIRAVAIEAGVAPMSVYNHFEDKAGLLRAVIGDGFVDLRHRVESVTDEDPVVRLMNAGLEYRQLALARPALYRLMFDKDSDFDGEVALAALESLTDVIRYGQHAGALRDEDPVDLTIYVWSCVHGTVSLELNEVGPSRSVQEWEDNFVRTVRFIVRGLRPDRYGPSTQGSDC